MKIRDATPRRLRWRVLSWLVVVSLLPLLVMAYQGYHCARQALIETVEKHLVSAARARASFVDAWLTEQVNDVRLLAENPYVIESMKEAAEEQEGNDGADLRAMLDSFESHSGSYDDLVIYDREWKAVASVSGLRPPGHTEIPLEVRRTVEKEKSLCLGAAHCHENAMVGLHVVHPIVDERGECIGFVFANLGFGRSLDPILQERSGLGHSGKVYLLAGDGKVITEPFKIERVAAFGQKVDTRLLRSIGSGVRPYRDYTGSEVLGSAVPLPRLGWTVVAEMDTSEALGWLGVLRRRVGLTAIATLLVLVAAAVAISRRLARPFKELARVAGEVHGGNFDERVAPLTGTEEQEVAEAFNQMLNALRDTQQRLVQAATLASVGELTSSIVHEMRNPLSSVKMNLQALRRQVEDDPDYLELAEIANGQVQRLEGMLSDLLAYGRPLQLNFQRVRFQDIVEDVIAVMRERAEAKKASIHVRDDLGERPLWADREQFCRALTNLVDNALYAVPDGGEVRLSAQQDPDNARRGQIIVSDNGPGVTEGVLESAFQPFTSTKHDGTGLGLANVRKIVELHGGTVTARNADTSGAIFTMSLSLAD
jgi:signal transduction histidine kinase